MTLAANELEFQFLDDNDVLESVTTWAGYRSALAWKKWGVRPTEQGRIGTPLPSSDIGGYNSGLCTPIYFLRGKYKGLTDLINGNMTSDYIVSSSESILTDDHPIYQYTWVAIQNRNSIDKCIKFGCSAGKGPDGSWAVSDTRDQNAIYDNTNYLNVRWMGIINGSDDITLSNLNTTATYPNFPHKVDIVQSDAGNNWWDATGAAPPAGKKIYWGYNNLQKHDLTESVEFKPWQINKWVGRAEGGESPTDRYGEHCMDIPAGKTLLGIATITKDSASSSLGTSESSMENISYFGWKYAEIECTFDYLVIT